MEHWFDRLARPHTRRATLKAAALAGASLTLPLGRPLLAQASKSEPCFNFCAADAFDKWQDAKKVCKGTAAANAFATIFAPLGPIGVVLAFVHDVEIGSCLSSAEVHWHRDIESCNAPQCGNPTKYPGGREPGQPPPACDPQQEIVCGDRCCNIVTECCACKGGYVCCASGRNCGCCPGG
jgi:hypothetical protein